MSELSPASQAVMDAYMNKCGWLDGPLERDYRCAAAVLRALASNASASLTIKGVEDNGPMRLVFCGDILAIAAELESQ